jgi:hypothetical protein
MIRLYNPEVKIYGLYGGEEGNISKAKETLGVYLTNIYQVAGKDMRWNWWHSDLAVKDWYKNFGRNLKFDVLNLIEWDLMIFGSLDEIYSHIPLDGLGLTGLTPLKKVENKWDWTAKEPHKSSWKKMLKYAQDEFAYKDNPYGCLGPGPSLPRDFLEKYAELDAPEFLDCNDELRLPLFGQILGFKLYDTGFYKKWFDKDEKRFFNCLSMEIDRSLIEAELRNPSGRRVFHPFNKMYNVKKGL